MHKYGIKIHYGKNLQRLYSDMLGWTVGKKSRRGNGGNWSFYGEEAKGRGRRIKHLEPLEGLIIIAGLCGMSEGLADITVGPFNGRVAMVGGVWYRVGALSLSGAVLCVVEVKAVTDVTEETRGRLLLSLWYAFIKPTLQRKTKTHKLWPWVFIWICCIYSVVNYTSVFLVFFLQSVRQQCDESSALVVQERF